MISDSIELDLSQAEIDSLGVYTLVFPTFYLTDGKYVKPLGYYDALKLPGGNRLILKLFTKSDPSKYTITNRIPIMAVSTAFAVKISRVEDLADCQIIYLDGNED